MSERIAGALNFDSTIGSVTVYGGFV